MLALVWLLVALVSAALSTDVDHAQYDFDSQNNALTMAALDIMMSHLDVPSDALTSLPLVNRELSRAVREKPPVKYLYSVLQDKRCVAGGNFVYSNHQRPPSKENPILYVLPFNTTIFLEPTIDTDLQTDAQCLDRLVRQTHAASVQVTTCSHPRVKNSPNCVHFREYDAFWPVRIDGIPITSYSHIKNATLAKRVLLFVSILHELDSLTEFLLESLLEDNTGNVGKEHLAASVAVGNHELFYRLVQQHDLGNITMMRQLLTFDYRRSDFRDLAAYAICKNVNSTPPHVELLDFLFNYIPIDKHHFGTAAKHSQIHTLQYLFNKTHQMHAALRNRMLVDTIKFAIVSENRQIVAAILNEITDFSVIDENYQSLFIRHILRTSNYKMLWNLLSSKIQLQVSVGLIIETVTIQFPLHQIIWLVEHKQWSDSSVRAFMSANFSEQVDRQFLGRVREAILQTHYHQSRVHTRKKLFGFWPLK